MKKNEKEIWSLSSSADFWKDIHRGEKVLHIYDDRQRFIDSLASFVGTGVNAGESMVLILTPEHRLLLEAKLRDHAVQLGTLAMNASYIVCDAATELENILENDQPDRKKFEKRLRQLLRQARTHSRRKVRVFDEMIVLLRQAGQYENAHRLEDFWSQVCTNKKFSLLCAYPRNLFENTNPAEMAIVYSHHSRIIRDAEKPLMQVLYRKQDNDRKAV
jgi:hypothetical protein